MAFENGTMGPSTGAASPKAPGGHPMGKPKTQTISPPAVPGTAKLSFQLAPLSETTGFSVAKTAGASNVALAAFLGLIFGQAARNIPSIARLTQSNPALHDAAIGAAVGTALSGLGGRGDGDDHYSRAFAGEAPLPPGARLM